jgi:hypothetical protein
MEPMTMMAGATLASAALPTLFGSGGKMAVPGAMARPTDPTSKFVDENGMLRADFQTAGLDNSSLEQGRGLLGNLSNMATQQGPSQSAQYLMGANEAQSNAQRDQLKNQQASTQATSEANLAMKGGLGTGSRERMAGNLGNQSMMQNQQINQQQGLNKLNTLANDENNKLGILKNLPGQYQSFGNEQMNRQVGDTQGGMNLLQNKYATDMQAFGANQMARTQAQGQNAASQGLLSGLF